MKRFAFVVFASVLLCGMACAAGQAMFAVDVPALTPLDFPVAAASPEAHWAWDVLGGGLCASIVAAIGKLLQGVIAGIRDARIRKACDFVWAGTMACYQEYVRVVKAAKIDGKLTLDEKNEALQYAYQKAVDIARNEGFDLAKTMGKEMVMALIEKYVGQSKAAVLAPLPDLAPSAPSV